MSAYTDDTIARFAGLELDDVIPAKRPSAPIASPFRVPMPVKPLPAVEVGQVDVRRADIARAERELANTLTGGNMSGQAGEGPGATFYDEGTIVMNPEAGLQSRRAWEQRPTAREAATALESAIAAERRRDYAGVPLAQVRLDEKGHLTRANGGLRPTEWSWSQLRGYAPKGALANNLNSWLGQSERSLLLRTRNPDQATGTRELFAALSSKYAVLDGHTVLSRAASAMPDMVRGDVKYDSVTTQLNAELTMHNPYTFDDEVAVGRVHRVGFRFRTADNGLERYRARCFVERVRCVNYTIVPFNWASVDRKHVGDATALASQLLEMARRAGEVATAFAGHWSEAARVRAFADVEGEEGARRAFGLLVSRGLIDVQGASGETIIDRLVEAWAYEPGTSHQAVNRAITRAAQSPGWTMDQAETLEEQAGEMLFQRVWTQVPTLAI